ncbi:DUF3703 domain-containing protein [Neptunomonas phycophila]|uniref:DUF3703 domain-containing protein n=1 Tax=Neptunomonas phycophila TaxID=1572645 RepID=A0AAW7XKC4_9GAMM|nr:MULTISPECIES: DUF3703 domain-containing protein [Neptunomonas]MDN2658360.1 DUF3703 domain-containing protein [Neptunomonas sp. CHC150]MDO6454186.1 DUF3703 domain-containing protein [Neptunomonas phycophila]MDP2523223.1 DUF3703 domain-containing protein [Neptunomonas phycophila]
MISKFSKNIAPVVQSEISLAKQLEITGNRSESFHHLENAHVLGQESTWWHVKVHILMFLWAIRQRDAKECIGQIIRIIGAATKTAIGLVPAGNTGGSNISPFKKLPISPKHQAAIIKAKGSV